ncbi:MAG: hypothetical protein ACI9Y7_002095 [Dokdonia sp.]|jgi:hypothetical protein
MKTNFLLKLFICVILFSSCSDDDDNTVMTVQDFVVAFENPSANFSTADDADINIVFSRTATEAGTVTIGYTTTNVAYGSNADFITLPSGEAGTIEVSYTSGSDATSFTVNKLQEAFEGETKSITFSIDNVTGGSTSGNTALSISFDQTAALGGVIAPEVGGPNQTNQVFIDLSAQTQTSIRRDSWELGFYSGNDFRVAINSTIYMSAAGLSGNDIDAVSSSDMEIQNLQPVMTIGQSGANAFVDAVDGDITGTAIAEILSNDDENPVYLINLGNEIPVSEPDTGSSDVAGDSRGWKKVRILRSGNDYVLQYADLDDTTHQEVTISKSSGFNFTFFSLDTETEVNVEPQSDLWDLSFTVHTNVISFGGPLGAYGFSDFVITNRKGEASVYSVSTDDFNYTNFTASDVVDAEFNAAQNVIGSSWRSVFDGVVVDTIFYIIEDPAGNIYKVKFNNLVNQDGERGFPDFEYSLLE